MTIDIGKIRTANTGTDLAANIHPATILAMCDEIERLRTLCNKQADELTKAHRALYGPSIADMVKGLKP